MFDVIYVYISTGIKTQRDVLQELEGKNGAWYSERGTATLAEADGGCRKAIHMPRIFVSFNYVMFRSCPLLPINQLKTHNASNGYRGV